MKHNGIYLKTKKIHLALKFHLSWRKKHLAITYSSEGTEVI